VFGRWLHLAIFLRGDHGTAVVAFARIFLHYPDIIVLDEATAALDPESRDKLMVLPSRQPDDATLISVGHRPQPFHNRKIVPERRRPGKTPTGQTQTGKSRSSQR
jgi:ABC-type uncharacterized transport system fused permease/ATPase subunit